MSVSKKAAKAKKIEVKKTVLEWCKDQVAQGHELTLHWEGGGDSGWVYFQRDGVNLENDYTEHLTSMMYHELDYGSWAGEFSAVGQATFDIDEEAFVGVDNYSEDETSQKECEFKFKVPKKLWFDSISMHIEVDEGDASAVVETSFNLKNGFLTAEHGVRSDQISEAISAQVDEFVINYQNTNDDFRSIWDDETFELKDGVENDGYLEFTITSIRVSITHGEEKDVYLKIDEEDTIEQD